MYGALPVYHYYHLHGYIVLNDSPAGHVNSTGIVDVRVGFITSIKNVYYNY